MKLKYILIVMILAPIVASAQIDNKIGIGYYGHLLTHPGLVFEYELEYDFSEKATFPLRFDFGYYSHPRHHKGILLELNAGFRRYYTSNLFIEKGIGIGLLETIVNGDGTFKVGDDGQVSKASSFNSPSFQPSVTFGIGYRIKSEKAETLLWFRPKIAWQYPDKTASTIHPIAQFGISKSI